MEFQNSSNEFSQEKTRPRLNWLQKFRAKQGEQEKYIWYPDKALRKDITDITSRTAEYMMAEKFKNVVLLDSASRPLIPAFEEYLHNRYPSEPHPQMILVNPKGFQTVTRTQEEVLADLQQTFPHLMQSKDQPTLIYDFCLHSGENAHAHDRHMKAGMKAVIARFQEAGFSKLKVATAVNHTNTSGIALDFQALTRPPRTEDTKQSCHPFGSILGINKPHDSVVIRKTSSQDDLASREGEIRRIITEAYPIKKI